MFNAGYKKYSNEDAEPYWIGNDVSFGTSGYIDLISDSFSGYQGIEVSDGYRQYKLEFNYFNIKLSSGNNVLTKALPSYGFLKNWNFYDKRNTSSWINAGFFTNLSVESLSQNLPDGTAKVTNALYLDELGKTGSPRITNTDVNVTVDINTKVLIKMKINAPTGFTIYSGKLKFSWLYGNGTFDNWVSVDIKNSEDFVLYQWKNHVLPSYRKYLLPFMAQADMIINNNTHFCKGFITNYAISNQTIFSLPIFNSFFCFFSKVTNLFNS
jgi:hypothetical protein